MRIFLMISLVMTTLFCYTDALFAQTADLQSGCAPLSVNFSPPVGLTTHFWDFQTGANSTDSNPSATFTTEGVYEVSLAETNGGPVIGTITITVFPKPNLDFTVDTTQACIPAVLNFSSTSSIPAGINVINYSWSFGDGGAGGGSSTNHLYNTRGVFDIALSVTTDQQGCDVTEIFPDAITMGGVIGLNFFTNPNPAVACLPPLEVDFINITGQQGLVFNWDFGNGNFFNGASPGSETFTTAGTFDVVLTAIDELGCTDTRTRQIFVLPPGLNENFPDTVCLDQRVFYEDFAQADTVNWTFPDDSYLGVDIDNRPFVVFTAPGPQLVRLQAANNDPIFCETDTLLMVYVDEVLADLTADPTLSCEDEITINFSATSETNASFQWIFFDDTSGAGPEITHTYAYADTLVYSENGLLPYFTALIATNPSGCRDTLIRADTLYLPNALFMPDVAAGCAPLTVVFADSSSSFDQILTYEYHYGDGNSANFTTDDDHSYTFTDPGEYEVVLNIENASGCRDTSYAIVIEVGSPLDIDFSYDEPVVCIGDSIHYTLTNSPPEIDWLEFQEPDTLYALYNGCLTRVINPDIIIAGPDVELSYEIDCETPFQVDFTSEVYDATTIFWQFGDGATSNEQNPSHTYSVTGDFLVTVTALNFDTGCPTRTDSTLICIRDLQADFTLPANVCAGEGIDLDASSTVDVVGEFCSNGFTWYFDRNGRPRQGNDTILNYSFTVPGMDYVTLVAKDINGCRDTIRKPINVYSITPAFTVDDSLICSPATLTFTDESLSDTTLVNWNWNFGDNTTANSPLTATHTYSNFPLDTSLFVVLELEDALGCRIFDTLDIAVYEPFSNVISNPSSLNLCVGEEASFAATQFTGGGSSLLFEWDFGDEIQTGPTANQTYPIAGDFPLTLLFTEVGTGCTGSTTATVNVQDFPIVDFSSSVDGEDVICAPTQIQFTNNTQAGANVSYTWNFGNGQLSSTPNPLASFDRGIFEVSLLASTSFGCQDSTSQTYELVGPEGDFLFGPQVICEGESVTFTLQDTSQVTSFSWDFGDGTVISNQNPVTHTYENVSVLGPRPVILTLLGADDACELSVTQTLVIRNVLADFSLDTNGDSLLCAGEYQLMNESVGADNYSWTLPDGTSTNTFEPVATFTPGTFTISLMVEDAAAGCTDELTQTYTFFSPPPVGAFGDTICPGDTAQLLALDLMPGATVEWSPIETLLSSPNEPNPLALPTETTNFQLIVTDELGCIRIDTVRVAVIQPLEWENIDSVRCPGDSLGIDLPEAGEFYIIEWTSNEPGLPVPPPAIVGEEDLGYVLTITDILGCFLDEYDFAVQSLSDSIIVPNIFSPNGDNLNDVFRIFSEIDLERTDLIQIESFEVYNRWGRKIYENSGPQARWDGRYNNKPAPSDVYIYRIVVDVLKSGRRFELEGQVSLIR